MIPATNGNGVRAQDRAVNEHPPENNFGRRTKNALVVSSRLNYRKITEPRKIPAQIESSLPNGFYRKNTPELVSASLCVFGELVVGPKLVEENVAGLTLGHRGSLGPPDFNLVSFVRKLGGGTSRGGFASGGAGPWQPRCRAWNGAHGAISFSSPDFIRASHWIRQQFTHDGK
jgi:hypothetical protein